VTPSPRLSRQMAAIVEVMVAYPAKEWYGLQVQRESGVSSGTLYPALRRLENLGWLTSQWEEMSNEDGGRPRRRLYSLTGVGETAARRYLARARARFGRATWNPAPGQATI
jgi:PadR family transcriptional regulator, regulatory protein PadR